MVKSLKTFDNSQSHRSKPLTIHNHTVENRWQFTIKSLKILHKSQLHHCQSCTNIVKFPSFGMNWFAVGLWSIQNLSAILPYGIHLNIIKLMGNVDFLATQFQSNTVIHTRNPSLAYFNQNIVSVNSYVNSLTETLELNCYQVYKIPQITWPPSARLFEE